MAVDLGVDEGNAVEVPVLELPDVDLLPHGGDQEPGHRRDGCDRTLQRIPISL